MRKKTRIGVVGTGFIASGFVLSLQYQKDLVVSRVLTRRNPATCTNFPRPDLLTRNLDDLLRTSDLIVECSGDVLHATEVVDQAVKAGLPVVTMDAEFQVTTGSYFASRGYVTEAEGDQPGCLAALHESVLQMGFRPLVFGNIKGFLNLDPSQEDMQFWSRKQGISLPQVTAFTDGTKVQIEQALVANAVGAGIAKPGLAGLVNDDVEAGARELAHVARAAGHPISDYILCRNGPAGVFIVAEHDAEQRPYLRYLKLGDGPYYVLLQNYHLCHLEIQKTIRRVLSGGKVLINNGATPSVSVAAVAKRRILPGTFVGKGIGSFVARGEAVRMQDAPDHLPIGLLANAVVTRTIEAGQQITFDDVELPMTLALKAWREIRATKRHEPAIQSQAA
jgi:predicted homoserine dehydrogenase-like protein